MVEVQGMGSSEWICGESSPGVYMFIYDTCKSQGRPTWNPIQEATETITAVLAPKKPLDKLARRWSHDNDPRTT